MKVSTSWLSAYTPIKMDAADLAEALTMAGLEVESVSERYAYLNSVSVGRIDEVEIHPNAEKLKLCRVSTGGRQVSVVCGAPNVKAGMFAPLALPGTVFPDGTELRKTAIRGQTSAGMLCSEAELGLGTDKSGIMVLDSTLTLGDQLATALGISDTVLEFDLTPNRPDCLCVVGIAREIAVIQKTPLNYPGYSLEDREDNISALTSVAIEAPDHCPRYAARLVDHIKIESSPFWLQDRLLSVGLRPINNIVDITNFVMMETGQPLHAFDFERLAENRIVVRTAAPGETFVTLDDKERILGPQMLMICDGEKPVAIGGVMGGLNSEIESDTTRVLIESAYFTPSSIRRTSKQLGLNTEASYRFERGVDPDGTIAAINRTARLMMEISGGKLISGLIDEHPQPQSSKRLMLSTKHTNRLLGTQLNRNEIGDLLKSIEFSVEAHPADNNQDQLAVQPPSFRVDVTRPEDLMEEVARLSGYNNIPTTYPLMPADARSPAREIDLRNRIRDLMTGLGFTEAITYSFIHRRSCDDLRLRMDDERRSVVDILNPLTEDQAVMRTSMIPGLLNTAQHNIAQQMRHLKLFEIGKIFIQEDPDNLPREIEMLVGLWSGARHDPTWHAKEILCDFYDIKGIMEGLLRALKLDKPRFTRLAEALCTYTRPGYSAQIRIDDTPLGIVGEIHPQVIENFDLKQTAYAFEINFNQLVTLIPETRSAQPTPKFPAVFRDITIYVTKDIEAQDIFERIYNFSEKLLESLQLLDVFTGDPIPSDKKSISIRVTYRSPSKTLEDEDVHDLHKSITDRIVKAFDAALPA
jgi:phenylalanyl-tRNA synthetase beta chain